MQGVVVGGRGHAGVVSEKERERAENEYSKHCFNLKQRCFQENEFQWSWAKNNYRDFLVLFCEWRASLFSGDARGRKDQSQEIEVMPLCPFTSTQHSSGPFFLPFSKSYWHRIVLGREGSGSSPPTSWIFYSNNSLFTLIRLKYWNWMQDWVGGGQGYIF